MRLACEIRLDLPPNKDTLSSYRFTRQLTEDETERLLACRGRTYLLVSLSEIASVHRYIPETPLMTEWLHRQGEPIRHQAIGY